MTKRRIVAASIITIIILGGIAAYMFRDRIEAWFYRPTKSSVTPGIIDGNETVEVVAQDLTVPWEVAFLPNGDLLVSERSGSIKRVSDHTKVFPIAGVKETHEGGLLGLALHPDFASNGWIYLYYTATAPNGLVNKVERYRLHNDTLTDKTEIISGIPAANNHDGGRIAFGPDRLLYIATGDALDEQSAQDVNSLAGKILRVRDDGKPVSDNPFGNAVYSYGHRNPQGLAWDSVGQLWATEHGPSGSQSGHDELNRIKKGGNYGWPVIVGDETRAGMEKPVLHSGANDTWAPSGLAYANGSLFFAGLRGQALYQAKLDGDKAALTSHFKQEYGRLRAVAVRDGYVYFSTSNTDGRGNPKPNDDKVLRIKLTAFN